MKSTVRLSSLVFVWMLTLTICLNAQTRNSQIPKNEFRYDITAVQPEISDIIYVKVYTYSKEPKVPAGTQMKNGVHGVIFKGVNGFTKGAPGLRPLVDMRDENTKKDFFDKFFADRGDYGKYVSLSNDGSIDTVDKINGYWRIGVFATVNVKELRKALVAGGIKLLN